jgi:Ca2+-binding RTX toxin-like protein
MSTILELSEFSSAVYGNNSLAPTTGEGGNWTLLNVKLPVGSSTYGYYAEAWQNSATGEIVIANRGTDPSFAHAVTDQALFKNLLSDAQLAVGNQSAAAQLAQQFAAAIAQKYPNSTITETGHSLGGYEAQAGLAWLADNSSLYRITADGVTFDAPGIPSVYYKSSPSSYTCLDLYAQGDFVHLVGGTHLGTSAWLPTGLSLTQEFADYAKAFTQGAESGIPHGEIEGSMALVQDLLAAHGLGQLSDPSTASIIGYLNANPAVGGLTAQQFIQTGQGTPASSLLNLNSGTALAFTLNDGAGSTIDLTVATSGVTSLIASATSGSSLLGQLSATTLNAEVALEGAGSYIIQQAEGIASSLASASNLYADFGVNGVVLGASPVTGTGLPGQLLLSGNAPGRYDYNTPVAGTTLAETIDAGTGQGTVWVGGQSDLQLQGGNPVSGTPYEWSDANGTQYTFTGEPDASIGTLTITNGLLGSNPGNSITITNFNLSSAESLPAGFEGIHLPGSISITANATIGTIEPATFRANSNQSFTISTNAPATYSQTFLVTLTGPNAADFATSGVDVSPLNSNGTFSVTLLAGLTDAIFTLQDITSPGASDIANGTTFQLTASLPNVINPSGPAIQSPPLSVTYTAGSPDTSTAPQTSSIITGTVNGGVTVYQGDGGDDYISAGAGPNLIEAQNSASDSIIGGTGSNTVYGGAGNDVITLNGNDLVTLGNGFNTLNGSTGQDTIYGQGGDAIINGNGGKDQILAGMGTNQIYAGAQTGLQNAIANALSGTPSGVQGDVISVLDGNNTVVGGDGNDLITTGTGNDVVVLGPGNNAFLGGWNSTNVTGPWSFTVTQNEGISVSNVTNFLENYNNTYAQPYNGETELPGSTATGPVGAGNDTVYAGNGNDYIALANGNGYIDAGSGNDTLIGGMGNNTIVAGSGADWISGGGGTSYIEAGSGSDTIYGGDGNNTITGGSGNSTIYSANYFNPSAGLQSSWAGESSELNYVIGETGNELIYGSGGSDTLIGGSGNATIYGGSGNENIVGGGGTDILTGGSGNDTIAAGGAGNDSLYANGTASSTTSLVGGNGSDFIEGGSGSNTIQAGDGGTAAKPTEVLASWSDASSSTTIYGGAGVDFLQGGAGSNVIYAGEGGTANAPTTVLAASGLTTVYGGLGTDYIQGGSGTDVLYAGDGGTQTAPTTVFAGTGVATVFGGDGEAVLEDLQSGSDVLQAGTTNDTVVGTGIDTVVAGSGDDLLQTNGGSVTFDIAAGTGQDTIHTQNGGIENIVFGTGLAPTTLVGGITFDSGGNSYLNLSSTNVSVAIENALTGGLGSVTFTDSGPISIQNLLSDAFGGGDTIVGYGNSNLIVGTKNNDSLKAGTYFDTISSWGSGATITGGSALRGDVIYSAGASASITSGTGADIITASGNNDTVTGGSTGDYITVSGASSVVRGTTGNDSMTAAGTNDSLIAGTGNTIFYVNNASAVVQDLNGNDTVVSTVSYALPFDDSQVLTLSGTANIVGTGNANSDTLTGGAGLDTLVSGNNENTLIGGSGNTTFVINAAGDVIENSATTTSDTVQSSFSYTLPANVNTLVLTGTAALTGTANSGNDTLVSNTGADTLYAGTGTDTFVLNDPNVVVQGATTASTTVNAGFSYTLPSQVNGLVLTGTAALTGTANSGNDTLVSNSGVDTLVGGSGADVFIVNNSNDVLTNLNGSDTIESSQSYTLPAGIGTLLMTGSANVTATGNATANVITGNSGNDTIDAGSGVATLVGGAGADTFEINNSADVVQENKAGTGSVVQASASFTLPTNVNSIVLTGAGNVSAAGNSGNDSMVGGSGSDTLTAGAGIDTLVAGSGLATLVGGAGNDTFVINNAGDTVQTSATTTSDTVQSSANFTLPANVNTLLLTGSAALNAVTNSGSDSITANAGSDTLTATTGTDTLVAGGGVDTLVGGSGTDTFLVNNSADAVSVGTTHGNDTVLSSVSYVLPANVSRLVLTGSANVTGTANSNGADSLIGNAGSDTLTAEGGTSDTLIAGSGLATLVGSSSGTVFVINNPADVLQNISAGASNELVSSINKTLPTGVDTLELSGTPGLSGTGNNDASNTLIAVSANDTLISGTGATLLEGGPGTDTFVINNAADTVQAISYATNIVEASISYTAPANVSTLILTGSGNLAATGNMLADSIVGNAGHDTLTAGVGNDTLVAGSGLATLTGGKGNDTFVINNTGDVIQNVASGEHNTLLSSVTVTLPTNINALLLSGSGNLTGTANAANDFISGNAGSDTLAAGVGADTLAGGTGIDTFIGGSGGTTFIVDNTADVIQGASSAASNAVLTSVSYTLPSNVNSLTLTGPSSIAGTANAANDTLTAGEGSDTLYAGSGQDTLVGGSGNTTFVVNNAADVVQDANTVTSNVLNASVTYTLPTNVNNLVLTGTAALEGTGNGGSDTLTSNSGLDTLIGGSGNDTFIVSNAADVVQDAASTANNVIQTSLTYALPTNVNSLMLTGSAAVQGTANGGNDTLTSNTGIDTLVGGSGNDTFVVNNVADVVNDSSSTASNTVDASVTYTLPTDVNALVLTGSVGLTATGNAANDVITANTGNDTLVAGSGTDTLVGGAGSDTFVVNSVNDVVQDTVAGSTNTISSSVSYTLPTNVYSLALSGTAAVKGTGNGGNDTLISNTGVDTLVGGSSGTDVFVVNNAADVLQNVRAGDTIESSVNYTLPAGASELIITGTANLSATGNSAGGTLLGGTGNDTLSDDGGVTTMIGGAGNTTFIVNNAGDVIQDAGTGTNLLSPSDSVQSSVSFALPVGVDSLTFTGSGNVTGVGNSDNSNLLTANYGNDLISGGTAAFTTINGGSGTDTLNAGAGFNVINAGTGGTVSQPVIVHGNSSLAGIYTQSTINGGTGTDQLWGGPGTDVIYGGSGLDTTLEGGSGQDTLYGGSNTDWIYATYASDIVYAGSGGTKTNPTVIYTNVTGPGGNTIYGGTGYANAIDQNEGSGGNSIFYGGSGTLNVSAYGADTLVAGTGTNYIGDATYGSLDATPTVVLNSGFGKTTVWTQGQGSYTNLDFGTGLSAGAMTVSAGYDSVNAVLGLTISGTTGTLYDVGGLNPGMPATLYQQAQPAALGAISFAGSNLTLAQLVAEAQDVDATVTDGASNQLTFTAQNATSVTGSNTYSDTISAWGASDTLTAGSTSTSIYAEGTNDLVYGGTGYDTLEGYGNADTLYGGSSLDTFVIGNSSDVVVESSSSNDTIIATVNYTLPSNIDTLELGGSAAIVGTANSDAHVLVTGNSGNDTLVAGSGTDTLTAGYGSGSQLLQGGAGSDYLDASNDSGSVTLIAGSGAATLHGGAGADTYVINSASDVINNVSATNNTLESSISYSESTANEFKALIGTGSANLSLSLEGSGSQSITANSGNDTLSAQQEGANTTLTGGSGSDLFIVGNASDVISNGSGNDTVEVEGYITYTLGQSLTTMWVPDGEGIANSLNDLIVDTSGYGNNTLVAGSGLDTLEAGSGNSVADFLISSTTASTTMDGGSSPVVFVINNASDVLLNAVATDTIQSSIAYTLPTSVNTLVMLGSGNLTGTGNANADSIVGNTGNDTLISGAGVDTLVGGTLSSSNDVFVVNNSSDAITVGSTHGVDTIESSVSFTASANVADLTLTGTANLSGTGNSTAVSITANSGTDTLTAGTGVATLVAGSGTDTFVVNNASDVVQDSYTTTNDTVKSSVTYTLPSNVNYLVLTGSAALEGTANSGNDTLASNSAADILLGGAGNDVFVVTNSGVVISDSSTTASNTVQASVTYTLPTNVNTLTFTGTSALKGTANNGNDTLNSNTGKDTLVGGTLSSSSDLFVVNNASDIITVGSTHGTDTIQSSVSFTASANVADLTLTGTANLTGTGNSIANVITANAGNDTLTAGTGVATLIGGSGNDIFVVNSASDVVQNSQTTTNDTVKSSVAYTLPTNVNNLVLTGTGALKGTANNGNDTLTSNTGLDTLVGGSGNDTFVVSKTTDIVQDTSTTASNSVQASVTYVLPTDVNGLTLTGTSALKGTANSGNDTLTSNTGVDTLVAGTLSSSNDLLVVNNASDVLTIGATHGNDTIQSSVSYVVPTNAQYLNLTGTGALTGTGNSLTDLITGNTGNDTLKGGTGIAVLEGGKTAGQDQLQATSNQAALIAGGGSSTLSGGAYKDFYAAGSVSDSITTGATANVVSVNMNDGADTLQPTTSATNVLSLGAGIDTESLTFTKSGNNLVLNDGVGGDSITFSNWYAGSSDQDYTTLQVVEIASSHYNANGSDPLRNKALEEFSLTSLVSQFNTAGSPNNWALSNGMPSATISGSNTTAYGGDLAYYFGLNGNLTGMTLTAAQNTLTNASYATGEQTIDSWSSISGGPIDLLVRPRVGETSRASATSTEVGSIVAHSTGHPEQVAPRSGIILRPAAVTSEVAPVTKQASGSQVEIAPRLGVTIRLAAETMDAAGIFRQWQTLHEMLDGKETGYSGLHGFGAEPLGFAPIVDVLTGASIASALPASSAPLRRWNVSGNEHR